MRTRAGKRAVKHARLGKAWRAFARGAHAFAILGALVATLGSTSRVGAQSLEAHVQSTLRGLYETTPAARQLARTAKGILVFPEIARDNYVFGPLQSGSGALLVNGRIVSYYEISSVAYGMQAGVLSFAGALFLMSDDSLRRLDGDGGWEVGKDGGVLVMAAGSGAMPESALNAQTGTMESTGGTMAPRAKGRADVYAFVIGETSLMTGIGREGWKIVKAKLSVVPRFESP
jgi:lipid-binding SYLF domain-containing protein